MSLSPDGWLLRQWVQVSTTCSDLSQDLTSLLRSVSLVSSYTSLIYSCVVLLKFVPKSWGHDWALYSIDPKFRESLVSIEQ